MLKKMTVQIMVLYTRHLFPHLKNKHKNRTYLLKVIMINKIIYIKTQYNISR